MSERPIPLSAVSSYAQITLIRAARSAAAARWDLRQIGGSRTHYLAGPGKLGGMTTAGERLLVPGPEEKQLAERAGTWTVTATMWPAPAPSRS